MYSARTTIANSPPSIEEQICQAVGADFNTAKSGYENKKMELHILAEKRRNHEIDGRRTQKEEVIRCKCGNHDNTNFRMDPRTGDLICCECGIVCASNVLYEGDWTRTFEDGENNTQLGQPFDPLMSTSYNLRTGMTTTGRDSQHYAKIQMKVENGLTNAGNDSKRTRVEYKDKEKSNARFTIDRVIHDLGLVDSIATLAHRYYCLYRDDQERLVGKNVAIAQCILLAYEEKKMDGDVMRKKAKGLSFDCPSCKVSFASKTDVLLHDCIARKRAEKKETTQKKDEKPKIVLLKKVEYPDEEEIMRAKKQK